MAFVLCRGAGHSRIIDPRTSSSPTIEFNVYFSNIFFYFMFFVHLSLFLMYMVQQIPLYFIIMRLNLKLVLILLCLAVFLITLTFWSHCGDLSIARGFIPKWEHRSYHTGNCLQSHIVSLQMGSNQF